MANVRAAKIPAKVRRTGNRYVADCQPAERWSMRDRVSKNANEVSGAGSGRLAATGLRLSD
jgi:hypothetical protein